MINLERTKGRREREENITEEEPNFTSYDKVKTFQKELFKRFICDDAECKDLIVSSILVKNSRVFITGNPESGKTTLVRLIAEGLSKNSYSQSNPSPPFAKVTGAPEQTMQKVISTTNISKLVTKGEEEIIVRPIVKAPIKFLNEINRFSKAVQDSLLSLLEENEVEYGGEVFTTPDFLCFADMNPYRGKIDLALRTRFLVSIFLPFVGVRGDIKILDEMFFTGKETRDLAETMPSILSIEELKKIWKDVTKVKVPNYIEAFLSMLIWAFKACKHEKSKIMPGYLRTICQKCEFNNEICSHIKKIPGERASIAGILYSRARAWLHHRKKVNFEDIIWVIPWVISHRIKLSSAVKSEVVNPWKWSRRAVENLIHTKWYYSENGEKMYGIWAKGLALVAFALNWECPPILEKILDKFYSDLSLEENAKFEAVRKLRNLAYGNEESRGDLVLQEIYKMARENFKEISERMIEKIRPQIETILRKDDATLDEVLNALNKLEKALPEESEPLQEKLTSKIEKLTVRVSLKFPGRTAEAKKLLNSLGFEESQIADLLNNRRLIIRNENARVKASGEFLIFRAGNVETAKEIRDVFFEE